MIYSKAFVWLHFPKCAGKKIEKLFEKYFTNHPDIYQDPVGIKKDPSVAWHDSIAQRKKRDQNFSLGKKDIICSIRKLPSWLESRFNFEYHRSPDLPHKPERLLEGYFLEARGYENHADYYMKKYLPESILNKRNVRFIRTEFFEADFKSIFGDYLDISIIPEYEYNRKVNTSQKALPDKVLKLLYSNQAALYKKCPYWNYVENKAY
jgi:hypothetical protein